MKTFKDLQIWEKAMELVTEIYANSKSFPKEEAFGLTSQLRRSAVSVPSNISEGYGRNNDKEFLRFLYIAKGSLFEIQTQLEIARLLKYLTETKFSVTYKISRELEAMMAEFMKKVHLRITQAQTALPNSGTLNKHDQPFQHPNRYAVASPRGQQKP